MVLSFPSGPSTTEKTDASGEDDLMMETIHSMQERWKWNSFGRAVEPVTTLGRLLLGVQILYVQALTKKSLGCLGFLVFKNLARAHRLPP